MTPLPQTIQHCSGLLIDIGGTLRMKNEAIPGASDFIRLLKKRRMPFVLFSNNSRDSKQALAQQLFDVGFSVEKEQIITSGTVTIDYLLEHHVSSVYLIGSLSFAHMLEEQHIELSDSAEQVVVGLDDQLTYNKLMTAARLIKNGAHYIATESDVMIHTNHGMKPGVGATIAYLRAITGRDPDVIIGKPYAPMLQAAMKVLGTRASRLGIIGDQLPLDMKMAQENGMISVLVLSGATTKEEAAQSEYQPDYVVQSSKI